MTTTETLKGGDQTSPRPMDSDGLDRIVRTGGMKATAGTAPTQKRPPKRGTHLLQADQSDEKHPHDFLVFLQESGPKVEKPDFLPDFLQAGLAGLRPGDPDGVQSGGQVGLQRPPSLAHPALDPVSHHGIAAGFGDDDGHAAGGSACRTPVELEVAAAFTFPIPADRQKFRPAAENALPGEATVTPRCGGRSGAPHLWAEGGDDRAPYDARSRHALPWFSCGHESRTGVSACAWRGCKWVSFREIGKGKIVPRKRGGVNPQFPKEREIFGFPQPCWKHGERPAAEPFLHVPFSRKGGRAPLPSFFLPVPTRRGAQPGW